jgi:DNA-binding MarR family transcriptional regulator
VTFSTGPGPEVSGRLGYLLKQAMRRLSAVSDEALAPFEVDDRRLAVLLLVASNEPMSQQQAAERLSIDRTTMVALLDDLESKGLVVRVAHPGDRRRNVIKLAPDSEPILNEAFAAWNKAEQTVLAVLEPQAAEQLRESLQKIIRTNEQG